MSDEQDFKGNNVIVCVFTCGPLKKEVLNLDTF